CTSYAHCASPTPRVPFCAHYAAPADISAPSLHDALPIWHRATVRGHQPAGLAGAQPFTEDPHEGGQQRQGDHHRQSHGGPGKARSEEHTSELQSRFDLVRRPMLEKKNTRQQSDTSAHIDG